MYEILLDVVACVYCVIFTRTDGSVLLPSGQEIHMDALRSNRVWTMPLSTSLSTESVLSLARRSSLSDLSLCDSLESLLPPAVPVCRCK